MAALAVAPPAGATSSLRFNGARALLGANPAPHVDLDRVKIPIDNPETPADIGAGDFTIEFWMKGRQGDYATNPSRPEFCVNGDGGDWIQGNIILDRALWGNTSFGDFGLSVFRDGVVAFGVVRGGESGGAGLCGSSDVLDDQWHHVAATREAASGRIALFVDGRLEAQATGHSGDVSYEDGRGFANGDADTDPFLVLGAEKYSLPDFPSFSGWIDELRLSTVVRYSADFTPVTAPFAPDGDTAALYHFDSGSGDTIVDATPGSASNGQRRFGGVPAGPLWSGDTPFAGTPGVVRFDTATYDVGEADTTLDVMVLRTGGAAGAVSVDFSVTETGATADADFRLTPATLSWADGDAGARSISVQILDDADVENTESLRLALLNPTGGVSIGAPSASDVRILDDDVAPVPGSLAFDAPAYDVTESNTTLALTVRRSGGTSGAVSVDFTVEELGATLDSDFRVTPATLNWADGDATPRTIDVEILDDTLDEPDESLRLTLTNVTGGASIGAEFRTEVRILDDDEPGTLRFDTTSYDVGESDTTLGVSVLRTGGSSGAVSVEFAVAGSGATAGVDFVATPGTLDWADGDAGARTIDVQILDDTEMEGTESLTLTLFNVAGGAAIGTPAQTEVRILDDDGGASPGALRFDTSRYEVDEGDATVLVTVLRTGGDDGAVSVDFTVTEAGATAGTDFDVTPTTLSWADGDSGARTVSVRILDDTEVEAAESFYLRLVGPTGGALLGVPDDTEIRILDDDVAAPPGRLRFDAARYDVGEDDGSVDVIVRRAGGNAGAVSVDFAVTGAGATAGSDFVVTPATLAWGDGDTSTRTITVTINEDAEVEDTEALRLTLNNPTGGASVGSPGETEIRILDNDRGSSPGVVRFEAAVYEIDEGAGSVAVEVRRTGGSVGAVSVGYTLATAGAKTGVDYRAEAGTLRWGDGESGLRAITVEIVDDADAEPTEALRLTLINATGGALIGMPQNAEVRILDDDDEDPPGGGPPPVRNSSEATALAAPGTLALALALLARRRRRGR